MASQRYGLLRGRVSQLARRLPRPQPTGNYNAKQLDATLAFRLLAHAEIESCLEDLVREVLNRANRRYSTSGLVSPAGTALCAYYGGFAWSSFQKKTEPFDDIFIGSIESHHAAISSNHGIREENVFKLLLPVGVRFDQLDASWLAGMNSYGAKRGATAHRSVGAQQPPDPVQERAEVAQLVAGLRDIDKILTSK